MTIAEDFFMTTTILTGDVRQTLQTLPRNSIQCCVTSPPYYGLRSYLPDDHPDKDKEIGGEETPEEFIKNLVEIFRGVHRVLKDDGVIWVNMGDSYYNYRPGSGGLVKQSISKTNQDLPQKSARRANKLDGLKEKDLIGIPWMLAFALRADGWYLRQDIIWCLSGGTTVYAQTKKGEFPMTIKDMVRLDPSTVKLWNGEKWTQVLGWGETPRPDRSYEIELRSGQRIGCTAGHLWPTTTRGNVRADELMIGDIIQTCRLPEPAEPKIPSALDDEMVGWFVGLYIAEGSRYDGTIQIASHVREEERFEKLRQIAEAFHGTVSVHKTSENGCSANLNGPLLNGIIDTYVSGRTSSDKHFHPRCWTRSDAFLRAILDGYLSGDGHWDAENERWRLGYCNNDALTEDIRTLGARLGISIRLKRTTHKNGEKVFPGYRGEVRFNRSSHGNSRNDAEIVAIRASRARKFWDIAVEDAPHLFSLASGVLTHNCKPNPMPESVEDRCTKSHEYIFLLTKNSHYYFDNKSIKEPVTESSLKRINQTTFWEQTGGEKDYGETGVNPNRSMRKAIENFAKNQDGTRNKRSVWNVTTNSFSGAHFATFPPELIEPCILAGSKRGDTILDPFGGAGTTGLVAQRYGRDSILCEINQEYAIMAGERIKKETHVYDLFEFPDEPTKKT